MPNTLLQRIGFAVGVGTLLAFSGLFETALLAFPVRWIYWTGLILIGTWLGAAIFSQLEPLVGAWPWVARWLLYSVALSLPMFGMVAAAQGVIGYPISMGAYPTTVFQVWLVTAAVTGARLLRNQPAGAVPPKEPAKAPDFKDAVKCDAGNSEPDTVQLAQTPRLTQKLKPKLRGSTLWALSAEDHYVRVHTADGDELVLKRLSDAIEEAEGVDGVRVHRSWWVAASGVLTVKKRTEGGVVILKNGVEVPISRTRFPDVKSAGWI